MSTFSFSKMDPLNFPMSQNVQEMMDDVREFFWTFENSLTETKKEATRIFFNTVYNETPKLSGYASANWKVAVSEGMDNYLPDRIREIIGRTFDNQPLIAFTYTNPLEDPEWKINSIRYNSYVEIYNFVPYIEIINKNSTRAGFFEYAVSVTAGWLGSKLD